MLRVEGEAAAEMGTGRALEGDVEVGTCSWMLLRVAGRTFGGKVQKMWSWVLPLDIVCAPMLQDLEPIGRFGNWKCNNGINFNCRPTWTNHPHNHTHGQT